MHRTTTLRALSPTTSSQPLSPRPRFFVDERVLRTVLRMNPGLGRGKTLAEVKQELEASTVPSEVEVES